MATNVDDLVVKDGSGISQVKSDLDELKERIEETSAALAKTPKVNELDDLKEQIKSIKSTMDNLPGDFSGRLDAMKQRVDELQTGAALLGNQAADVPEGIKAITREVKESDLYKSFEVTGRIPTTGGADGSWSDRTKIPSYSAKAATPVLISDMAGGSTTVYRPGIFMDQQWQMDVASRIPVVTVSNAATYTIPKETLPSRYGAWKSTLAADVDGDPTPTSTATFTDVDGLIVGGVVRFWNASDALLGSSTVVSINTSTKVVTFTTNSLDFDATSGWKVTSENYGVIAEQATKPSGYVGTSNVSFNLKTLPTIIPTTVNALNTINGLQSMIEQKLPERHMRNLSYHVMYGDDGTSKLQGLRTYTGAQSYAWSSGVSGDNRVDAVMKAANLIPWTSGIGVIMSQTDFPALQLLKGSDGHYLRTGNFGMVPMGMVGASWYLGAYELVFDYAVTTTHFTVINWADASEIADLNTASLLWGYINDDFEKNIIRARYEATLCHAIKSTQAYVVGQWDSAP